MSFSSSGTKNHTCWSCQGVVEASEVFCPTCRIIQPPDSNIHFFDLFGLPTLFAVDLGLLENRYQALQRQFHPDRFATRGPKERIFSLEHVIRLNKAYQTMQDPLLRSDYLLEQLGWEVPDPGEASKVDPEFLMEMMEVQETLESVDLNLADAGGRLGTLRAQIEERLSVEQENMHHLFDSFTLSPDLALLDTIAATNDHFRYYRRFLDALDRAEETLFGE